MDLFSKKIILDLLKKYNTKPSKRLGQNFLIDKNILKNIIKAANIQPNDIILEIGPGIGILTRESAKKAKKVIVVEKDHKMIEILKETMRDFKNIEIIQEDILKISNFNLINSNYKIVANLPFYITSPVIRKFLETDYSPKKMILTIQKEVAQRICAKPPKMNLLAVSVQFYAKPDIISYISKKSFWPQPKVDAAILKISLSDQKKDPVLVQQFFKIIKAGFSQPRKQLINNLSRGLNLDKKQTQSLLVEINIRPNQRAESLTIDNWIKLTKKFIKSL